MKTAFLIDCDFYLRRLRRLRGDQTPEEAVKALNELCLGHMVKLDRTPNQIYRVLTYDCPPLANKVHRPISKTFLDFSKTPAYKFRTAFHQLLKIERKVALRLGHTSHSGHWTIKPVTLKELINRKRRFEDLTDEDFRYDVRQKGVDMKIGLDIASISSKRLVDQIVLVAGDSDFVPAAKTARREGVDFILDPMGAPIMPELHEHIDGLQTVIMAVRSKRPDDGSCTMIDPNDDD